MKFKGITKSVLEKRKLKFIAVGTQVKLNKYKIQKYININTEGVIERFYKKEN